VDCGGTLCDGCGIGQFCTDGTDCLSGYCQANTCQCLLLSATTGLAFTGKDSITWTADTNATQYDVVRGSTFAFPVGPGGGDETCFDDLAGPVLIDATVPAPGTGFWYLSRGENACGSGTFGTQGVHGAPGPPRVTTTCP
jgi:hypothetical protein